MDMYVAWIHDSDFMRDWRKQRLGPRIESRANTRLVRVELYVHGYSGQTSASPTGVCLAYQYNQSARGCVDEDSSIPPYLSTHNIQYPPLSHVLDF
jgi:hypothetical protein